MLDKELKTEIDEKLNKDSPVDWNQITNKPPANGYAVGTTPPEDKTLLWVDTSP